MRKQLKNIKTGQTFFDNHDPHVVWMKIGNTPNHTCHNDDPWMMVCLRGGIKGNLFSPGEYYTANPHELYKLCKFQFAIPKK